ncbi:protein of unknown function [Paraburkholderia dioscoreae]|uniref:Uncharacterized protein n=1 Tax=Paraburkholderia dioscoreae TaxID=2604047 RepID=A0A5Q4ZRR2_9BURK|nr:protein of unknown function [Paraburkholderia dioscoreae]
MRCVGRGFSMANKKAVTGIPVTAFFDCKRSSGAENHDSITQAGRP